MSERHALETRRLLLVPAKPEHAELMWPHLNDERMWVHFPALRPPTMEALRLRYERWTHEMPYLGAVERWENWILLQREGNAAIGEAQATYAGTNVYIAYGVFPAFQRQGFAKEAMREVLAHARDVHDAHDAIAQMAAANHASVALAESLGFRRAATRRAHDPGHGYFGEEYVYGLKL